LKTSLSFAGRHIGLIVRGKTSEEHDPGVMEQHADCILSDGAPIGFFGEGNGGASSGQSSQNGSSNSSGGTSGSTGIGMTGAVYDFKEFQQKRPHYVDGDFARKYNVVSAVLRISVSADEAKKFDTYWAELDAKPKNFYLLGGNCSTRASAAFRESGILRGGIPGLDTPNNLWKQLKSHCGTRAEAHFGLVNFQRAGASYNVTVSSVGTT